MRGAWTIGVDPGLMGAVAVIDATGELVTVDDMPSMDGHVSGGGLARILSPYSDMVAWIEDVHSMPGQGVASTFKFGRSVGVVAGVCGALDIPIRWVTPQRWKRTLGLTKDKAVCRRRASELFPSHTDLFARQKDDGRAEAALVAYYGQRQA